MPSSIEQPRVLLDAAGIHRCIEDICKRLVARWKGEPRLGLVGIYQRGVPFSEALASRLREAGKEVFLGKIDITQYRDDLNSFAVLPTLLGSELDFDPEEIPLILCDEVIYTARTVRAALEELLDFGRPRNVELAVLVDRAGRELPFHADYAGIRVDLPEDVRVNVCFASMDGMDEVTTSTWNRKPA